ncbi:MAG: hypothetical protein L6V93_19230 [Clostridiales bacterium]|nr:MAG: hypothetical protein L6V93_19230 [Clostridiales bacterium]
MDKDGNFIEKHRKYKKIYTMMKMKYLKKILKKCSRNKKIFPFSKLRHTQRDSGLVGIPDEEISRRARDKKSSREREKEI